MAENWLSVKDAALQLNCSQSSIKRLFQKLEKEGSNLVKKENGRIFLSSLAIAQSERLSERPNDQVSDQTENLSDQVSDHERQIIKAYVKTIDILENEINEKNIQIERLQIDSDQKNKIIMHLQTRLQINPPVSDHERPNDQVSDHERPSERPSDQVSDQSNKTTNYLLLFFAVLIVIFLVAILANLI